MGIDEDTGAWKLISNIPVSDLYNNKEWNHEGVWTLQQNVLFYPYDDANIVGNRNVVLENWMNVDDQVNSGFWKKLLKRVSQK